MLVLLNTQYFILNLQLCLQLSAMTFNVQKQRFVKLKSKYLLHVVAKLHFFGVLERILDVLCFHIFKINLPISLEISL
jgi:hypothetical protein